MRKYDHDRILALFDSGLGLKEVAEAVGCSVANVCVVARKNGRNPRERRYPQSAAWDRIAILADYQSGMPLKELLRKHRVSVGTLHLLRLAAGLPKRSRPSLAGELNYQYKHGLGSQGRDRKPWIPKQVAAICLGHVLPEWWVVHHMGGDPTDNRPENLAVFPSRASHARYHQRLLRLQRKGLPVDASQMVSESGGWMLPVPDHPILLPQDKGRLDPRA